jgi:hypothetical protein
MHEFITSSGNPSKLESIAEQPAIVSPEKPPFPVKEQLTTDLRSFFTRLETFCKNNTVTIETGNPDFPTRQESLLGSYNAFLNVWRKASYHQDAAKPTFEKKVEARLSQIDFFINKIQEPSSLYPFTQLLPFLVLESTTMHARLEMLRAPLVPTAPVIPEKQPPSTVTEVAITYEEGQRQTVLEGVTTQTSEEEILNHIAGLSDVKAAVFLMGGAGEMSSELFEKMTTIIEGVGKKLIEHYGKIMFGSGGTDSGIMKNAGKAFANLHKVYPDQSLSIGVNPANVVTYPTQKQAPTGKYITPLEKNHTYQIPIHEPDGGGDFGSETKKMYQLFNAIIAKLKQIPSIGICANGGGITTNEVIENMQEHKNRRVVLLKGTRRSTDEMSELIENPEMNVFEKNDDNTDKYPHAKKFVSQAGDNLDAWKKQLIVVDFINQSSEAIINQIVDLLVA